MIPCGEKAEEVASLGAKEELENHIKNSQQMFARIPLQHCVAVMGRKRGTLLNLVFTLKSKRIHGQKKKTFNISTKG